MMLTFDCDPTVVVFVLVAFPFFRWRIVGKAWQRQRQRVVQRSSSDGSFASKHLMRLVCVVGFVFDTIPFSRKFVQLVMPARSFTHMMHAHHMRITHHFDLWWRGDRVADVEVFIILFFAPKIERSAGGTDRHSQRGQLREEFRAFFGWNLVAKF